MKTLIINEESTTVLNQIISDAQAAAITTIANIAAPTNAPSVEIVWDSAGSEPQPQRPILPLRVSGYDQPADTMFTLEVRNGQTDNDWSALGDIQADTTTTFDVGMNAEALRCVVSNLAGSATGQPLMLS